MAPRRVVEQMTRRLVPTASDGWAAAGVDEFLRAYLTPRGRAAFYAAARNIYLDEPHGEEGFWTRLEALAPDALFIWGKRDALVPIAFMRHVERALPAGAPRRARLRARAAARAPARDAPGDAGVPARAVRYNCWMSFPPGPRLPRLVQAARLTAEPYAWMAKRRERYGDIFSSHFPFFGRVVYVADPELVKQVFTGSPDRLPRRRGERDRARRRARRELAADARRGPPPLAAQAAAAALPRRVRAPLRRGDGGRRRPARSRPGRWESRSRCARACRRSRST